ncbi:VC0807 family protein [Neobacillus sp. PS3-34]|uniref:VC0807 family protein n=1 Tax=Neobacillus sp. PS3-34 TaxID=3070678 RepID=UPI0027DFA363|nr:VC0807 family protein [Neobacillus sp. PS3-34]WML48052.1 VC0807 family protein [Neobacillus sp. PS3-34]
MFAQSQRKVIQSVLLSIFLNGIMPLVVYNLLLGHYSSFNSLLIATLIPLADNFYHFIKHKKADAFGLFMLTGFILSLVAFFMGGSEKWILMRESMVTGLLGFIFIGSLFFKRPLIYHFAIRFSNSGDEKKGQFAQNWNLAYFRYVIRLMTAVWGVALLGEAIIKMLLVFRLSVSSFLAVSPIVFYSILGVTIAWTVLYRRHAKTKMDEILPPAGGFVQ